MSLILTLNAGSSSIKFALYQTGDKPEEHAQGQVDGIGGAARLTVVERSDRRATEIGEADHALALSRILDALDTVVPDQRIAGIGHRVVHGGPDLDGPRRIDDALEAKLQALSPLAPLHQPHNLAAIGAARAKFPEAVQVACFDTAFHRGHPWLHDTFALPRCFYDAGIRRYGFHGLSYDYLTGVLARDHPEIHAGNVVLAHLGNGASLCGVQNGRSVSSTMGFSALDGLPMGTRSGRIDPGVLLFLLEEGMTAAELTTLLYTESGLKGLSGLSHDMRALERSDRPEAAEAIAYFTSHISREIAAMAAVLGGIDAVVFSGGIGENAAPVRAGSIEPLGFLGLAIDVERNAAHATRIEAGTVPILVLPTDEERVIARAVAAHL